MTIPIRTILTVGCIVFLLPVTLPVGALAQAKPDKDKPKQEKQEKKENQDRKSTRLNSSH